MGFIARKVRKLYVLKRRVERVEREERERLTTGFYDGDNALFFWQRPAVAYMQEELNVLKLTMTCGIKLPM